MSGLPFEGLSVIVTGDVEGFTRDSANEAIAALGGKPVGSVSGRTGLVIMGEGAGVSKMAKTRKHNLNVLDADTFAALVEEFTADPDFWDGHPVGQPVADYDRRADPAPAPVPDPVAEVPLADRHLVGKASVYLRPVKTVVPQHRMWCQCGHKWFGTSTNALMSCPVEAGTATLNTTAPWDLPFDEQAPYLPKSTARIPAKVVAPVPPTDPDVPVDPFDSFDPYDDIDPAHPGGDW